MPIYLYRERLDLRCRMLTLQGLICRHREESILQGAYYAFIPKALTLLLDGIELKKCMKKRGMKVSIQPTFTDTALLKYTLKRNGIQ